LRFLKDNMAARFNGIHRRVEKLHWTERGWLPACASQSTAAN
jgi:hypothetical protein